jgi:hypothetical protein
MLEKICVHVCVRRMELEWTFAIPYGESRGIKRALENDKANWSWRRRSVACKKRSLITNNTQVA